MNLRYRVIRICTSHSLSTMPKLEIDYNKALFLKLDVDSSDKTLINVEGNTLLVN